MGAPAPSPRARLFGAGQTGTPPAAAKPCAYRDYIRTTPAADPKAVPPPAASPSVAELPFAIGGLVDGPAPRLQRKTGYVREACAPLCRQSQAHQYVGKAAPAHVPEVDPELGDPVFPSRIQEPVDSWEPTRRFGGEHTRPDWFDAIPKWKTMGRSSTDDGYTGSTVARRPLSKGPNHAFQRILDLRAQGRHVGAEPAKLMTPYHLKGPAGAKEFYSLQRVSLLQGREEVEDEKARVILARMAEPIQKTYTNQLRWWELFCKRRGLDPIRVVGDHNRASEEELLLDFVVHSATSVPQSESTVKARLAAIRALHVHFNPGLDDPMASMRVDLLLQGYARVRGSPMRRHPVTPQMLRWIRSGISPATLWAALLLGFFFFLRASEYFAPKAGDRAAKGVRGGDLTPRFQGSPISSFALADEVVLTIRGSKTDRLTKAT